MITPIAAAVILSPGLIGLCAWLLIRHLTRRDEIRRRLMEAA